MALSLAGWGRKFGLIPYRSNGVPVARAAHVLVTSGNGARDARDWALAATNYRAALEIEPELHHIWIQLGHAEKESGNRVGAAAAYARAEAIDGADGEAAFNLGRLARMSGDRRLARQHLLRAVQRNPRHADAFAEFRAMIDRRAGVDEETMRMVMGASKATPARPLPPITKTIDHLLAASDPLSSEDREKVDAARNIIDVLEQGNRVRIDGTSIHGRNGHKSDAPSLVFDASDLISYFRNARLPTGIQRVQIETISNGLDRQNGPAVQICCFTEGDDDWVEIPTEHFLELKRLSVISGDRTAPDWIDALNRLFLHLSIAPRFEFSEGACLVNLGTSWWLQNYFLYVREAKRTKGIRYIPFVHDMIPVMTPQHCVKELTQDFITWTLGVFEHADFFLANSISTKQDLIKVAGMLGQTVAPDNVAVVPLDADFRSATDMPLKPQHLDRWYLKAGEFVLFVSTIESRKNHALAFDAWVELTRAHGADKVPKLVCVGNRGWLNAQVYERLDENPLLRKRVVMLSQLSDGELALLYRECLFTIYPSTYEGWGLPVTESLCYGKIPLLSDSSSLPEAGGRFADYFCNDNLASLVSGLRKLIFDPVYRVERERDIAEGFEPRRWRDIAYQIEDYVIAVGKRAPVAEISAPAVVPGAYHPIQRSFARRIWRGMAAGEIYRGDTGWWWPDAWGCWTKPNGGTLRFLIPGEGDRFRAYLKLVAPDDGVTNFELYVEQGEQLRTGTLDPGETRWVAMDLVRPRGAAAEFAIRIKGSHSLALGDRTEGLDQREIALGVAGFFACAANDFMHRAEIAEAIALNDEMAVAFNRERDEAIAIETRVSTSPTR